MPRPTVLVLNHNRDTLDLLRAAFEAAGFVVSDALVADVLDGSARLETLSERPSAVVFDVAPPYDEIWEVGRKLARQAKLTGVPFVITTTDVRRVHELADEEGVRLEILGKPYNLNELVAAVRQAVAGGEP